MIKAAIVSVIILLTLSSCGKHVKDLAKTITVDKSVITTIDKSLIVTQSDVDTGVKIPYKSIVGDISFADVMNVADTATIISKVIENNGLKLTTTYNKGTKTYSAKAEQDSSIFHFQVHTTTTQNNNITSTNKKNLKQNTSNLHKTSDYTWSTIVMWLGIGLLVFIIGAFVYKYVTRK